MYSKWTECKLQQLLKDISTCRNCSLVGCLRCVISLLIPQGSKSILEAKNQDRRNAQGIEISFATSGCSSAAPGLVSKTAPPYNTALEQIIITLSFKCFYYALTDDYKLSNT